MRLWRARREAQINFEICTGARGYRFSLGIYVKISVLFRLVYIKPSSKREYFGVFTITFLRLPAEKYQVAQIEFVKSSIYR
jgi:hypothetical protein